MENGKVTARIDEIRKPIVKESQLTLKQHLANLLELRELAVKSAAWSAAVAAEMGRGKAAGLHVNKLDINEDRVINISIVRFGDEDEV